MSAASWLSSDAVASPAYVQPDVMGEGVRSGLGDAVAWKSGQYHFVGAPVPQPGQQVGAHKGAVPRLVQLRQAIGGEAGHGVRLLAAAENEALVVVEHVKRPR